MHLTRNQVYRKMQRQVGNREIPYGQFIDRENAKFAKMLRNKNFSSDVSFDDYLNAKYGDRLNADGFMKDIIDIISKAEEKYEDEHKKEEKVEEVKQEKTILGLKPIIFYSITGTIILSISTIIILSIKSKK